MGKTRAPSARDAWPGSGHAAHHALFRDSLLDEPLSAAQYRVRPRSRPLCRAHLDRNDLHHLTPARRPNPGAVRALFAYSFLYTGVGDIRLPSGAESWRSPRLSMGDFASCPRSTSTVAARTARLTESRNSLI